MDSEKLNEQWRSIWSQVNSYPDVDQSQASAFFSRLEPQAMSDSFLMLTADNDFLKSWVEQHYVDSIKRALLDMTGVQFTVAIAVDPGQEARRSAAQQPSPQAAAPVAPPAIPPTVSVAPSPIPVTTPTAPAVPPTTVGAAAAYNPSAPMTPMPPASDQTWAATPAEPQPSPYMPPYDEDEIVDHYSPQSPAVAGALTSNGINPASSLTFSSFVIGESNRMAYSAAVEVAESPGRTPLNPLFIYGKSGLGKTHLMRAIQNYIAETQPNFQVIYVDSGDFVEKYSNAAISHDKEKTSFRNFKTFYEAADVLLIDDVQTLQGKKQSLDMVFQLFNTLTAQGKQIVLAADRAPKNIDIEERYQSRFSSGFPIEVLPPELETKLGIVKSFSDEYSRSEGLGNFTLSSDIQMYIAENSGSNIRELKSAVTKVIYQMVLYDRPSLTIEEVRTLLENHFTGGGSRNLTVEDIQREVETFFSITHDDLIGPCRQRRIVYPRQVAIYLCRQLLDIPYAYLGEKFNRDHTTIMHSSDHIEDMLKDNRGVQEEIEALLKIIRDL